MTDRTNLDVAADGDHYPTRPDYSRDDWSPPHCARCGRATVYDGRRWQHAG